MICRWFRFAGACILASAAVAAGCSRFAVKEHPQEASIVVPTKQARIALLGFYPFKSRVTNTSVSGNVRTTTYTAELEYSMDFKDRMPFGTDLRKLPVVETQQISTEEAKRIAEPFLKIVRRSGIQELGQLIEEKGGRLFLKKRDVDFYVFGVHGPPFARSADGPLQGLTAFLTLFTFGLFPLDSKKQVESTFIVYDRDFKLVKEFKYAGVYLMRFGWLGGHPAGFTPYEEIKNPAWRGANPYPGALQADVLTFARDFAAFLEGGATAGK